MIIATLSQIELPLENGKENCDVELECGVRFTHIDVGRKIRSGLVYFYPRFTIASP
jgi:hypothetical protein